MVAIGVMFCGQRCMDQWFQVNSQTCLNAVGEIDKQTIPLDDAWYVEYHYSWGRTGRGGYINLIILLINLRC